MEAKVGPFIHYFHENHIYFRGSSKKFFFVLVVQKQVPTDEQFYESIIGIDNFAFLAFVRGVHLPKDDEWAIIGYARTVNQVCSKTFAEQYFSDENLPEENKYDSIKVSIKLHGLPLMEENILKNLKELAKDVTTVGELQQVDLPENVPPKVRNGRRSRPVTDSASTSSSSSFS